MKRLTAWLTVMLLLFAGLHCSAAGGFTCEYSPKSEKGSLFFIDISSSVEVSAAVMELRFDDSIAEYREVSAVEKSSTVRAARSDGCVKIALADSGAVKDKICRVGFKAVRKGSCTFALHISQATDAEPKLISGLSDYSLDVDFGEEDIASSSVSSKATSSRVDRSSSRSSIKVGADNSDDIDGNDDESSHNGGVFDLRQNHALKYILIGAGIVILIAALVFAGVLWGRKTANKPKESASGESIDQVNHHEGSLTEDGCKDEKTTEETPTE